MCLNGMWELTRVLALKLRTTVMAGRPLPLERCAHLVLTHRAPWLGNRWEFAQSCRMPKFREKLSTLCLATSLETRCTPCRLPCQIRQRFVVVRLLPPVPVLADIPLVPSWFRKTIVVGYPLALATLQLLRNMLNLDAFAKSVFVPTSPWLLILPVTVRAVAWAPVMTFILELRTSRDLLQANVPPSVTPSLLAYLAVATGRES